MKKMQLLLRVSSTFTHGSVITIIIAGLLFTTLLAPAACGHEIVGWGENDDDQATPPAGNDFIAVAAGGRHSLALKSDGSIDEGSVSVSR